MIKPIKSKIWTITIQDNSVSMLDNATEIDLLIEYIKRQKTLKIVDMRMV